ncbi:hypothetical protein D3C72_2378700 [compost metagenome]
MLAAQNVGDASDIGIAPEVVEVNTFDAEKRMASAAIERIALAHVKPPVQPVGNVAVA